MGKVDTINIKKYFNIKKYPLLILQGDSLGT